jgi:hypothetical protein
VPQLSSLPSLLSHFTPSAKGLRECILGQDSGAQFSPTVAETDIVFIIYDKHKVLKTDLAFYRLDLIEPHSLRSVE